MYHHLLSYIKIYPFLCFDIRILCKYKTNYCFDKKNSEIFSEMITSQEPSVIITAKYTINETCSILGIHRNTLRSYIKAGYIKPIYNKVGNRIRFTGKEISRFWNVFV